MKLIIFKTKLIEVENNNNKAIITCILVEVKVHITKSDMDF
jgi:hypothetical protein